MKSQQRVKNWKIYPSQKGYFGYELYKAMAKNKDIWLISLDLGWPLFDPHFEDFPDRAINIGASEQAGIGMAVGLALEGKIPFVYSIPNFLVYRPYEWIRNYVDYENIPIKMVATGRDDEYDEDGFTHQSCDLHKVLENFPNIKQYWPTEKEQIADIVSDCITNKKPTFVSLQRKA